MGITLHIRIDDHASPMLQKLDELLKDPSKKQSMCVAIAELIYDHAIDTCPSPTSTHFPTDSTGNLRDSHEYGPTPDGGAMVSATADYALYVHEGHYLVGGKYGTRIKGSESPSGKRSYEFVTARPWMLIAIEESTSDIKEVVKYEIDQAVSEASGETPEVDEVDISGDESGMDTSTDNGGEPPTGGSE